MTYSAEKYHDLCIACDFTNIYDYMEPANYTNHAM